MTDAPLVSVVVPTYEEADDIEDCLRAVAAQDHPLSRLEVLVVDGGSADGTADIARRALSGCSFASASVVSNPGRTTSSNLNVGLKHARGDIICRVDARTRIEPHYVRTCALLLEERPEVAVVGGAQVAIARDETARSKGIARALNNRWSMGWSPYRRATASMQSDTVYLGAFRRVELLAVGGWDERLVSNQDFDLNRRMARLGTVWFEASLRSGYLPRATYSALWHQYVRFGRAKVTYWRSTGNRPERRQLLLIAAPPVVVALAVTAASQSPTPAVGLAGLVAACVAGLAVADRFGASHPTSGLLGHVHGAAAIATVVLGWWSGVVTGALSLIARREAGGAAAAGGSTIAGPPGA
ncbi:MAG: glycosyltransferase [Actinomycetota bacterium]